MAAGGFKEFVAGETLDEDAINDFLMQGMLVFAGTAARGSAIPSPVEGQFTYLADSDSVEFYDGSAFVPFASGVGAAVVSGTTGSPTVTSGTSIGGTAYDIYEFTGDGSVIFSDAGVVDVLVLSGGGGGAGGGQAGWGGGGAGGWLRSPNLFVNAGTATVTVGAGGAGATSNAIGNFGGQTIFDGFFLSPAGAGGGIATITLDGVSGGGAGGESTAVGPGSTVAPAIGNNGGTGQTGTAGSRAGGGGGGQSAVGGNAAVNLGGDGGAGLASDITGTSLFYAGGGGGGSRSGVASVGGSSVGGIGGVGVGNGGNAVANRGSGGGGGGNSAGAPSTGGNGSSGVVIVRVAV